MTIAIERELPRVAVSTDDERSNSTLRRLPLSAKVSAALVLLTVAIAVLAPFLPLADPTAGVLTQRLLSPFSPGHLLGTDTLGRDLLSRLAWGTRYSLVAGVVPVLLGGGLGTLLGVVAGLGRPWVRSLIMRTLDVLFAFPALLLAIVIAATFTAGLRTLIVAITVIVIPPVARITEGETIRVRSGDYVTVARSSGAGWSSIAWWHVLPNIVPTLVVYCTSLVGLSIVYGAGLSFLGLGVAPPTAEWGAIVNELRGQIFDTPLLSVLPAVPILAVSVMFNVLGDGLRDAMAVGGHSR